MPSIVKKPCLNSSEWTYTGKEVSPTGLGYAPDGETEGTQMKGRDDTMWVVGRKNGVKVWNRVPTLLHKEEPVLDHNTPQNHRDDDDEEDDVHDAPEPPKVVPSAPKKVKKDFVSKIDVKDVTVNKDLLDRLNEVADVEPEPAVPEKKKRAPAKKKVVEPKPVPVVEPEPVVEPTPEPTVPEKKKRAPAKKQVKVSEVEPEVKAAVEPEVKAAVEPEKKKRGPVKKKEVAEGEKKKTDYQLFLSNRLKTIEGATYKERFSAAAKEWSAMTDEQKLAAAAMLK